jgi:hypothetical protein
MSFFKKKRFVRITGRIDTLDAVTMRCAISGYFTPESSSETLSGGGFYRVNEENPFAGYLSRITDLLHMSGRSLKTGKLPGHDMILKEYGNATSQKLPQEAETQEKTKYFETLDIETGKLWSARYLNLNFGRLDWDDFEGTVPADEFSLFTDYDLTLGSIEKIVKTLQDEKSVLDAECNSCAADIEQLEHFQKLDIDISDLKSVKFLKLRFGRLPIESAKAIGSYNRNPYVEFMQCSESGGYCWGMYVAPVSDIDAIDRMFAAMFFEKLDIPNIEGTPADEIQRLTDKAKTATAKSAEINVKIDNFWSSEYEPCVRVCAKLARLSEAFELRKYAARDKDGYMLYGWVPEKKLDVFEKDFKELTGIELKLNNPQRAEPAEQFDNR